MHMLDSIEKGFISQNRGEAAVDHEKVLAKTVSLFTSKQMEAFRYDAEPQKVREKYGRGGFANGCLIARRLVEQGVPFVEVDLGGWDLHQGVFTTLERKLPDLDKPMAALIEDLDERGMLQDTVVIWMGEFGRTPRHQRYCGARPLGPQLERGGRRRWHQGWPDSRRHQRGRHRDHDRSLQVRGLDGLGLEGSGDLAGNDLHQQKQPPDEDRQRRPRDQRAVCLERISHI